MYETSLVGVNSPPTEPYVGSAEELSPTSFSLPFRCTWNWYHFLVFDVPKLTQLTLQVCQTLAIAKTTGTIDADPNLLAGAGLWNKMICSRAKYIEYYAYQ